MKSIKPHSHPGKLSIIDGRSAEGRRLSVIRSSLAEHVGGNPSVAQSLLIDRIAILCLRMELMDKRALQAGAITDRSAREYLGWNNSVSRMIRQLGLKGAADKQPSLSEYIARKTEPAAA